MRSNEEAEVGAATEVEKMPADQRLGRLRPLCRMRLLVLLGIVPFLCQRTEAQPNLRPYQPAGWTAPIVVSRVKGTTTEGASLNSAETLYLDWAILNEGTTVTSERFYLSLLLDGTELTRWHWDPPFNGNSYGASTDYELGKLKPGAHTLTIKIDPTSAVAESNEADNTFSRPLNILSGGVGKLDVTLRDTSGSGPPLSNVRVVLYSDPWKQGAGTPVSFTDVPVGTYSLKSYQGSTAWGEEYWSWTSVTIRSNQTTTAIVDRNLPYATGLLISNVTAGGLVTPGQSLESGTQLRLYATVRNPSIAPFDVRTVLRCDRSKTAPYDYDSGDSSIVAVPSSGGTATYSFPVKPTAAGDYFCTFGVYTRTNSLELLTGVMDWSSAFSVYVLPPPMNISGSVSYRGVDGVVGKAASIKVEAWEAQKVVGDSLLAEGYTDSAGSFVFTKDTKGNTLYNLDLASGETGTRDIYFKLKATNETVVVSSDWSSGRLREPYKLETDVATNVQGAAYTRAIMITNTTATPTHAAAWGLPGPIARVGAWLRLAQAWSRRPVDLLYPNNTALFPGAWPRFRPAQDLITVPVAWKTDATLPVGSLEREYAKAILFSARGGSLPAGTGPESHFTNTVSTEGFAFVEGWAEFLQAAVANTPLYASLESNNHWMGPSLDGSTHHGNVVEGAVASVLWDLYDSGSEDEIDAPFSTIWDLVIDPSVVSIWSPTGTNNLYAAWAARYGAIKYVDWVFLDHGMPVVDDAFEPNNTPSAAPSIEGMPMPIQDLVLADAEDWYRFEVRALSFTTSTLTLNFAPEHGALNLDVYDANLALIASATTNGLGTSADMGRLPVGTYFARVSGVNGDLSPTYALSLFLAPDSTPPLIRNISPASGARVGWTSITLSGEATDAGRGGHGIRSVTVNGQKAANCTAVGDGTANWSIQVVLAQGVNTLKVVAKDGAASQNATTTSVQVVYVPGSVLPDQPVNLTPIAGAAGLGLNPTLEASAFHDADSRLVHIASQWLVRRGSDHGVAFDSGEDHTNLLRTTLPSGVLNHATAYVWQVRHLGSDYGWSPYSEETSFTTGGPELAANVDASGFAIRWPTNAVGYKLMRSTSLGAAAIWDPVTTAPSVVTSWYVLRTPSSAPSAYYRLQRN